MRKFILPVLFAVLTVAGCVGGRTSLGVGGGGAYYDGYYDGYYGPFHDGYWGNDGAFWYSDGNAWHRDDGRHFRRDRDSQGNWNPVHGSGAHRDH